MKNVILKSIGETYRLPLLSKSFTITVNRTEVYPTDPMFLKVPLEKKYGEVGTVGFSFFIQIVGLCLFSSYLDWLFSFTSISVKIRRVEFARIS